VGIRGRNAPPGSKLVRGLILIMVAGHVRTTTKVALQAPTRSTAEGLHLTSKMNYNTSRQALSSPLMLRLPAKRKSRKSKKYWTGSVIPVMKRNTIGHANCSVTASPPGFSSIPLSYWIKEVAEGSDAV
jgi:hypothetical protein